LTPLAPPSPFFTTHAEALRRAARRGPVLDVACGSGRHALATGRAGLTTVAIDRDADRLVGLRSRAAREALPVVALRWDLETPLGVPLKERSCGAVLVFRFLYRPLAPVLAALLAPGVILLYETFTTEQLELDGGPRNPAFLLEPGELPTLFPGLEVLSFQEGRSGGAAHARLFARQALPAQS